MDLSNTENDMYEYDTPSDTDHESSHVGGGGHGRASSGSQTSRGSESSSYQRTSFIYQQQLSGSSSVGCDRPDAPGVCEAPDTGDSSTSWSAMPKIESKHSTVSSCSSRGTLLPWCIGANRERIALVTPVQAESSSGIGVDLLPGEFVMRSLFADFAIQADRKMETVMAEPPERPISKVLQRGEDPQFDQLLSAFGSVAEHCLPSLLRALFGWYERQMAQGGATEQKKVDQKGKSIMYSIVSGPPEPIERSEADIQMERRDLAVEFLFCLALIEVLKQLPFHPGHEDLITYIEQIAFKHFKYREGIQSGPNAANIHIIADLYAEVIGVLAQSRFMSVRKHFMNELKELRTKEASPTTTQSIISLLMGMKFFRVKMVPIEEFEASFQFMQECAQYFLEVKDKDVKHALAGLFVEILVPVAAAVKNEVNVPCLKNFVDMLYSQTLDASTKSKHRLALFPLVTCLLCVSQKTFFLANWHYFLAMCLSNLKNRDPKMCRVALESLYRLLWVYMIRIKCESNQATQSRLQSIVNSLFPKGSKAVVPRDTPLNIFVKIIQFIAQERLDFAMKEIVFDLLSVGRNIKIILTPERMSIGLRSFLVVADSLQQKEGEPPMPRTMGVLPSGNTLRVKKTFLNKMLTEDTARSIGMNSYFPHVRRVFVDILRALDVQYGRPLMMTNTQNVNKEPDEMITGERKPRIDLFRTCVAAVPRLIPDGMTGAELVDLLARLTVHLDEELRVLAYQSLQTLVLDFPDWRQDVICGFTQFLARDVLDTFPQLVDNGLRMLLQLLTSWKNALSSIAANASMRTKESPESNGSKKIDIKIEPASSVLHMVEGFALVMLCNCRVFPRKLAVHILREVKMLLKALSITEEDQAVIDVIDKCCPQVIEKLLPSLPAAEKTAALAAPTIDLQWIADRSASVWTADDSCNPNRSTASLNSGSMDPWSACLFAYLERGRVLTHCPLAVTHSWPFVFGRVTTLFTVVDPTPVSDNRASLLRSSAVPRRPVTERDVYMHLWKNYVTFAYRVVPPAPNPSVRCASPDLSLSSSPDSLSAERGDSKSPGAPAGPAPAALYKLTVPLLRCEAADVRDAAAGALGKVNAEALKDLMEELVPYIREAVDRKQENMRRRRRRDALRLQLVRVLELIAEYGTFGISPSVLDRETMSLHPTFVEYMEGARLYLENETKEDKDAPAQQEVKLHFCDFIRKMIKSFSLETCTTLLKRDLRSGLFNLFAPWSGPFAKPLGYTQSHSSSSDSDDKLQMSALQAMSALLCCGGCFNPSALAEDGLLYPWLDMLLSSADDKIYQLARETAVLLLEANPDIGPLLDWALDRCYTGQPRVADGCFMALAAIFSAREYPCDHYTAVINVTLLNTGCPRAAVHDTALQLLQLLDKRFFGDVGPPLNDGDQPGEDKERGTLDLLLSTGYCRSHMYLSRQLAQLHPELTMPMFSEITHRFQTARPEVRQLLLQCLLPWLHNMELVDPGAPASASMQHGYMHHCHHPPIHQQYHFHAVHGCCETSPDLPTPDRMGDRGGCVAGLGGQGSGQIAGCGGSSANRTTGSVGGRRDGWGSAEATEMVLNNLFYITAKFADEHPRDVEELWGTLCSFWPNNLKVILRYLVIVSGMAPNDLLPYAKRVALYLARARSDRLLEEMMIELQTVETLNCLIERTETPPFYRLTSMRKASSHSDGGANGGNGANGGQNGANGNSGGQNNGSNVDRYADLAVEKGTIHTKRHSGEDPIKSAGSSKSDSALRALGAFSSPRGYEKTRGNSGPPIAHRPEDALVNEQVLAECEEMYRSAMIAACITRPEPESQLQQPHPHPLPMPEYGGYFAPLTEYLPDSSQPISGFHRCNVAVMLLTDIVVDGVDLDWAIHVPLMLHILFLGLDHTRPLVRDHCKRLLLHLLIVLAEHNDHLTVARILLNSQTSELGLGLPTPALPVLKHNFTEPDAEFDSYLNASATAALANSGPNSIPSQSTVVAVTSGVTTSIDTQVPLIVTGEDSASWIGNAPQPGPNMATSHVIKSLIEFLSSRQNTPLWNYEDITAKVWSVRSAEQIDTFLQHVLRVFRDALPHALINERWAQTALQLGLSCSSRHYAGRSLQVYRALRVPISPRMLSDILSRLVETVAEQGEDMQGYVTELLLTLEAAVDSLESDFRPLDFRKEIFKSTPNLNNKDGVPIGVGGKRSPGGGVGICGPGSPQPPSCSGHMRSTSYSVSCCTRKTMGSPANENKEMRGRTSTEVDSRTSSSANKFPPNLSRSRSAQSLKLLGDTQTQDDKLTILAQLFWLAVGLLESDYEHEFLLAARLLSRVLHRLPLDRPDARDKIEKIQQQLRWTSFPGVHALLLKGCTNPNTYEPVVVLLSQFTPVLDLAVVDPTQSLAFPMNVVALLPYMVLNYEDANELCIRSAENIAQVSTEKSKKLEYLGTVMTLYSRRTFCKESFQWTKCVVKYLYDTYAHLGLHMLAFLVEVLEKGSPAVQLPILSIIHCMLHYVDLATPQAQSINSDLLRVITKYLEGTHWKEALKILKLVVNRSSSLVVPPAPQSHLWESSPLPPHPSFSENDKKELPGRTMDFTFDLSQTPLIGRRYLAKGQSSNNSSINTNTSGQQPAATDGSIALCPAYPSSPRRSVSLSPADNTALAGWKRPWLSQGRVRENMVNLLSTCGQRVGLPKSPSVIFSQSSDLMERQSSMASSTEEVSGGPNDLSGGSRRDDHPDQFGVFKDFDFLEYESESVEGESTDNFNWGVRRRPLSDGDLDGPSSSANQTESFSEETPVLSKRKARGMPEESSEDEMESESPLDDVSTAPEFGREGVSNSGGFPPSSLSLRDHRTRNDSVSSGSSAGDLGDVTPCNASPNLSALLSFRCSMRDDTEDVWRREMQNLLTHQSTHHAPDLFKVLAKLLLDVIKRSVTMSREALMYLIGPGAALGDRISSVADLFSYKAEPPRIWFALGGINSPRLAESLRFGVLEVQEHLETYFDRKDHVSECLDAVRANCKLQMMFEPPEPTDCQHEEILAELGRALYKLLFQLLLLIDSCNKMLSAVTAAAKAAQLADMSVAVQNVRTALCRSCEEESSAGEDTPTASPVPPPSTPPPVEMECALLEFVKSGRWNAALAHVRKYRQSWILPESLSGDSLSAVSACSSDDDDVALVLNLYCKILAQDKPNIFILTRTETELADVSSQIMESLYQVQSALSRLEQSIKVSRRETNSHNIIALNRSTNSADDSSIVSHEV